MTHCCSESGRAGFEAPSTLRLAMNDHDHNDGCGCEHEDTWQAYMRFMDDKPATVLVDESFEAGDADTAYCIRFSAPMPSPDESGLPSEDTSDEALDDFEDALASAVETLPGGRIVARLSTGGRFTWFAYAGTDKPLANLCRVLAGTHPKFPLSASSSKDPEGNLFNELLPTEEEVIWNNDIRVLMTLHEHGDDASQEREFTHEAAFDSQENAEAFVASLEELGFAHAGTEKDEDGEIVVTFTHQGRPDIDEVFPRTSAAWAAAEATGGIYDGWGCPIVKAAE
jgi:hypothetical protein